MAISTIRIDAKLKRMATRYKKMQHRFKALERKRLTSISKVREATLKKRKVKLGMRMDKLVKRMKALVAKKNSVRHIQLKDPKRRKRSEAKRSGAKRKATSSKRKVAPKAAATQKLTTAQIDAGAKFLTCRNLATIGSDEKISSAGALDALWRKCQADHGAEGIDISDEHADWVKALRKGDTYSVGEVVKALPWLFNNA